MLRAWQNKSRERLTERLGQSLFPALCVSCKKRIREESPYSDLCLHCAMKFPWRREHERILPLLSWRYKLVLPKAERAALKAAVCIVPLHYDGQVPYLIRTLKFNQAVCNAKPLGEIVGNSVINELLRLELDDFVFTSVPLSKKRLRQRGYNQAAELAKHAARYCAAPYLELLEKPYEVPRQSEFEYAERLQNVSGVYAASRNLRGLKILLIDDILTSGATLFSARQAALEAGASLVLCAAAASGRKSETQALVLPVKSYDD